MLQKFDDFLNAVTMYRLVLYCLMGLVGVALIGSVFGVGSYAILPLLGSLTVLLTVGFVVKVVFEKIAKLPANFESSLITTFILFFVLAVPTNFESYLGLAVAVTVALVSKYTINWRGAHLFNPAALGALVVSLTGLTNATWWVTASILPFVVVTGILILRKTRQFSLFFAFAIAALGVLFLHGVAPLAALVSYPLIFMGTVMLTEPATMPSSFRLRLVFGVFVGVIFGSQLNFGFISAEPQVALLVGNIFAFVVAAKVGQMLRLVERKQLSPTSYEFSFDMSRKINYQAGQYLAWTLDKVAFDSRGNRRSFTIASAPHEKHLKLGIKFYEPSSQFKKTLLGLKKGEGIHVSALAGDFVLPNDKRKKLLFIAGGIGVTPFRSMIKDVVLSKQKRDITLLYFAAGELEVLYKDVWQEALGCGVKVVPLINREKLDDTLLQKYVPDFKGRDCYLSGPPFMVRGYKKVLQQLGVSLHRIHADYFSGY